MRTKSNNLFVKLYVLWHSCFDMPFIQLSWPTFLPNIIYFQTYPLKSLYLSNPYGSEES